MFVLEQARPMVPRIAAVHAISLPVFRRSRTCLMMRTHRPICEELSSILYNMSSPSIVTILCMGQQPDQLEFGGMQRSHG